MLGPKIENTNDSGNGNTQIGHNTGTVQVGLTFAEHEHHVRERLVELRADLERAHGAEKQILQHQIDAVTAALADLDADYKKTVEDLTALKLQLARFDNQITAQKKDAALAALDRGDRTLARALFEELAEQARLRQEDASREEALLQSTLGEIAEAEIRWHDAARHYATAARLTPTFNALQSASRSALRSGDARFAAIFSDQLVKQTAKDDDQSFHAAALNEHAINLRALGHYAQAENLYRQALAIGEETLGTAHPAHFTGLSNLAGAVRDQGRYAEAEVLYRQAHVIDEETLGTVRPEHASRLNNLAGVVKAQGRYSEAEDLFRKALTIDEATLGTAHPEYATRLNNLAAVVQDQGRYPEAEDLYRRALKIDEATLGTAHPTYAIHLNNLALVLRDQGRYAEAEDLYRKAITINEATIGTTHPVYATRLNNLAGVLRDQGRYSEAEDLYRQALKIDEATLGTAHPTYANHLNNLAEVVYTQGRSSEAEPLCRQALAILRTSLGDAHPKTLQIAKNLLTLLRSHTPNSPDIPALHALIDTPPTQNP